MSITRATEITGTILETTRGKSSQYGNPSYRVLIHITAIEGTPVASPSGEPVTVTLSTAPNAGIAYGLTNREYREAPHTFILNRHGKITSARKVAN